MTVWQTSLVHTCHTLLKSTSSPVSVSLNALLKSCSSTSGVEPPSDAVITSTPVQAVKLYQWRIMYLIWPSNLTVLASGYALGWRTHEIVCVLAVVETWVEEANLEAAMGTRPSLVGGASQVGIEDGMAIGSLTILSCGSAIVRTIPDMQVIVVDPPDPVRLQYLVASPSMGDSAQDMREVEKQEGYTTRCKVPEVSCETQNLLRTVNDIRNGQRAIQQPSHSSFLSSSSITQISAHMLAYLRIALVPATFCVRAIVTAADCRVIGLDCCLQDHSAALKQLSLRAGQILDTPSRFRQTLHSDHVPLPVRSRRYMRFWNTVWLVVNDLLMGFCMFELFTLNSRFFATHFPFALKHHLADDVISALIWLDDWPVGLKLNTPLSEFYSSNLAAAVGAWRDNIIPAAHTVSSTLIVILAYSSLGGLTLLLAVLQDLLVLLTLHLRVCDKITRGVCKWQLESLGGLWNLFRGKRWNVLRQRTDSYQYDVDQLFLGTLLFTVSAFLFPTVLSYAGLFYGISIAAWTASYALRSGQMALNSFPLFEVLLRIKEPSRLPAGVRLVLQKSKAVSDKPYLELRNSPKSFTSIFTGLVSGRTRLPILP